MLILCSYCSSQVQLIYLLIILCYCNIWHRVLQWQGIRRSALSWSEEVEWAILHAKGRNLQAEVYRMELAAAVYHIWQERNCRIFQQKQRSGEAILKMIVQEVHCRGSLSPRLARQLQNLKFYP